MLGEILRREMEGGAAYERAMKRFLAKEPGEGRRGKGPFPFREELHERADLR